MKPPIRHLLVGAMVVLYFYLPALAAMTDDPGPPIIHCNLAFPEAIQVNPNTVRIPFEWVGRIPAVTARIDTVEGTFFFDTGAERLLLNNRYFTGDTQVFGVTQYGVTGNDKDVFRKTVDTLQWDNLYLPNVKANVLDLSHIEAVRNMRVAGIIGYEVFKDYEIFLDYPSRLIVLTRLDDDGYRIDKDAFPEEPFDSLDFELANHGIVVKGSVDGQTLNFNLDTGAEINLLDRKVGRKVLKHFSVIKRVNLMGTGQDQIEVLAGTLSDVKCGKQWNGSMRTLLTSMDHLNTLFGMQVHGVLGFEYLRPRRTLINYKRQKLFFFKLVSP